MHMEDTIAAIGTAMGESGIGIIRISGNKAIETAAGIFSKGSRLLKAPTHTIHYGHIQKDGEILDEVLLMLMRAPRTFTGEDTVEINCHGGTLVMGRILSAVLSEGARMAEPGEFTKRAFLNGKMDLTQAEAVIDIIEAKNRYALASGVYQLKGNLRDAIQGQRSRLLGELAYIEAALDDPEHYDLTGYSRELIKTVEGLIAEINGLFAGAEAGRVMKEGVDTVIVGKPNAGKSSLLNLLAKEERAIVTDIAGTTRDTITEHIRMSGISLNITDTAGIRDSSDPVEQIGVKKAREASMRADLILYVLDGSQPFGREDEEIFAFIKDKKAIILLNKVDQLILPDRPDKADKICLPASSALSERLVFDCREWLCQKTKHPIILFSAKEGIGLEELEETIKNMFYHGEINPKDSIYIGNLRHLRALEEALSSLEKVKESILSGMAEDFFTIDMAEAYEKLGEILGESPRDDVIQEIFARFCTGK